jgi:hypothetical protein
MQYLILNQKIHLLNSICAIDEVKFETFKREFNYDQLKKQEEQMRACIISYRTIQSIFNCYHELVIFIDGLISGDSIDSTSKKTIENIREKCQLICSDRHFHQGKLDPVFIMEQYLKPVDAILDQLDNPTETVITQGKSRLAKLQKSLSKISNTMISDNDQDIYCEYLVKLQRSFEEPIVCLKVMNFFCLMCDQPIGLDVVNRNLDDAVLRNIDVNTFKKYFNRMTKSKHEHFIRLTTATSRKNIVLYYNLEEKIPVRTATIKISKVPEEYRVFTSMIYNPKIVSKTIPPIVPIITAADYQTNNPKQLFTDLLNSKANQNLVKPEMFRSFVPLVENSHV